MQETGATAELLRHRREVVSLPKLAPEAGSPRIRFCATSGARHPGGGGDGSAGDQQGELAHRAVYRAVLLSLLPGSRQCRLRCIADEQRSRFHRDDVRLGRRYLFLRIFPVRSAKQSGARKVRSTAVDRPDHGDLGSAVRGHGADLERDQLSGGPLPARRGRGRLLSRDHTVPDLLVPLPLSGAYGRALYDGDPDIDGDWRPAVGLDPRSGRSVGPSRLAVALHLRGYPDGSAGAGGDVLSDRWP